MGLPLLFAGAFALLPVAACSTPQGTSSTSSSTVTPAVPPPGAAISPPPAPVQSAVGPGHEIASDPEPLWFPWYDWALEIDGKPSMDALFFRERNGKRLLISVPGLAKTVLINTAGQQVWAIENSGVTISGDGDRADLATGAESGATEFTYTTAQREVIFFVGDKRFKIEPKSPLEGQASLEAILAHTPLYRKGVAAYKPDAAEIANLKSFRDAVEIEVFFGTWCAHCKVLVPKFMKSVSLSGNPAIKVRYIGVPKGFGSYGPAKAKGIQGIPTFIFLREGKEFGRIPGEPSGGSIEHAMSEILRSMPR